MSETIIEKEYKSRIDKVIDYIIKNLNGDISLQTLSQIANYSPFHFQRIFKHVTGETPKQYVAKLKLETAVHRIIVQPHKTINEIANECGFSSLAVFSRAMKNCYGYSPEKIRTNLLKEHQVFKTQNPLSPQIDKTKETATDEQNFSVRIVKTNTLFGVYEIAPFDDTQKIKKAFTTLTRKLTANEIPVDESKFYGILSPHQGNIYKAFVVINKQQYIPAKFNKIEIKGGKYAVFKAKGGKMETLTAAKDFFHNWLPDSGYKIGDVIGFESFFENPALVSYDEIEREIFIPIEVV